MSRVTLLHHGEPMAIGVQSDGAVHVCRWLNGWSGVDVIPNLQSFLAQNPEVSVFS